MANEHVKHINLAVSADIHKAAKQAALDKDISMSEYIRKALEDKLKNDNYIRS